MPTLLLRTYALIFQFCNTLSSLQRFSMKSAVICWTVWTALWLELPTCGRMATKSVDSYSHCWTAFPTPMCLLTSLWSMFVLVQSFTRSRKSRIFFWVAHVLSWSIPSGSKKLRWRSTIRWNLHQAMDFSTGSSLSLGRWCWTVRISFELFFHLASGRYPSARGQSRSWSSLCVRPVAQ